MGNWIAKCSLQNRLLGRNPAHRRDHIERSNEKFPGDSITGGYWYSNWEPELLRPFQTSQDIRYHVFHLVLENGPCRPVGGKETLIQLSQYCVIPANDNLKACLSAFLWAKDPLFSLDCPILSLHLMPAARICTDLTP